MKYRDHRGSLSESMDTMIEVKSLSELKKHFEVNFGQKGCDVTEIKFSHYGYDERNGWDTFLVTARLEGNPNLFVCGMSDGTLETPQTKTITGKGLQSLEEFNRKRHEVHQQLNSTRSNISCPECGSELRDTGLTYLTLPAQKEVKCDNCGYTGRRVE